MCNIALFTSWIQRTSCVWSLSLLLFVLQSLPAWWSRSSCRPSCTESVPPHGRCACLLRGQIVLQCSDVIQCNVLYSQLLLSLFSPPFTHMHTTTTQPPVLTGSSLFHQQNLTQHILPPLTTHQGTAHQGCLYQVTLGQKIKTRMMMMSLHSRASCNYMYT